MKTNIYKEVSTDNGYQSYCHASDNFATYILTSAYAHDMYSEYVAKYNRIPASKWYRKNFNFEKVQE